jgi:hypothetical protein
MTMRVAWSPPYDFSAAKITFVDAWPKAWRDLAPSYEIVPIDRIEMNALGSQIMGFRHWFTPASTQPLINLTRRLDAVIAKQNRACFVRLSSRSPKDSLYALRNGLCIRDGAQALAIILEGSERCAADLRMALDDEHPLAIIVRNWIDFSPWAEFRCFMVGRCWVGACQASHLEQIAFPLIADYKSDILKALDVSMKKIAAASPIDNAAFDLVFQGLHQPDDAILLDANPLAASTDTALFSSIADFDSTFRFRDSKHNSIRKISLPLQAKSIEISEG